MDKEQTIEELKEKIRAIQDEIKKLKNKENVYVSGARFEKRLEFTTKIEVWSASVMMRSWDFYDRPSTRYVRVVSERTREEALKNLDRVINALTELRRMINDVG